MRHVAFCLGLIALAATALPAPPAQAQKNEGMGVLGPTRLGGGGPRVDVNKPPRRGVRRGPRRDTCRPANPSGEPAIDKAVCANRTLLRKDARIALLFEALQGKTEDAKADEVIDAHNAWLESRKPCAEKDKDSRDRRVPDPALRRPRARAREAHGDEARDAATAQVAGRGRCRQSPLNRA